MSLTATVTPGKTFVGSELVTNSKLNQLAAPTVSISGTVDSSNIPSGTVTAASVTYGPWFYCTAVCMANYHTLSAASGGTPLPTALVEGMVFRYRPTATNTDPAVAVELSTIPGSASGFIYKQGDQYPKAGDILSGQAIEILWDGTTFQMLNPTAQQEWDRFAVSTTAPSGTDGLNYAVAFTPPLIAAFGTSAPEVTARILVRWHVTNTGPVTLKVDATATVMAVLKVSGQALVAGDIVENQVSELIFDGQANGWLLISPTVQTSRTTVPVRQTVLSGHCAATGLPDFLGGVTTTAISFQNTTSETPVTIAFAAGHDAAGSRDYVALIDTNAAAWTGLTTNGTYYLYAARDATTGTVTYGQTATQPTYTNSGAASTTSGDHTYLINEGQMRLGNGTTADVVQRVFVGECVVAANVVSTITPYMPRGEFKSGTDQTMGTENADQNYSETHQLGLAPRIVRWVVVCQNSDAGYAVGDEVPTDEIVHSTGVRYDMATPASNATTCTIRMPWLTRGAVTASVTNKGSYALSTLDTDADWKIRCYAWRGW